MVIHTLQVTFSMQVMWRLARTRILHLEKQPFALCRFFGRARCQGRKLSVVLFVETIDMSIFDSQEETIAENHRRRLKHPSRFPHTKNVDVTKLFKEMYEDQERKGSVDLNISKMSKEGKQSLAKAMSYLSLNEEDMEDEEVKVMREMNRLLSSNPKYKNLSPEELVEALDLKPEDKELVQQGLQQMLTSAEAELDKVDIDELFPDLKDSYNDLVMNLRRAITDDPSLQTELESWLSGVKEKLGEDVKGMEALSDEEFAEIALPPERLRNALQKYTTTTNRLGDLNWNANSTKEFFRMQSK